MLLAEFSLAAPMLSERQSRSGRLILVLSALPPNALICSTDNKYLGCFPRVLNYLFKSLRLRLNVTARTLRFDRGREEYKPHTKIVHVFTLLCMYTRMNFDIYEFLSLI